MSKRYPSYKPSGIEWICDIPEHWLITRIDKVSSVIDPQPDHRAPEIVENGLPYVGIRDINDDGTINYDTARKVSVAAVAKQESSFSIDEQDIVFCKVGTLGEPKFLKKADNRIALSATLVIIKPFQTISPGYLRFTLESYFMQTQMLSCVTGSTRPALGIQQIRRFLLLAPPVKEQSAISLFLDQKTALIDKTVKEKQRLIELLLEERTALINQAVTRGLNPDVQLKPSGVEWLDDVPENWKVVRLKYVATINPSKKKFNHDELANQVVFLPMEKVSENGTFDCTLKRPVSELLNGFTYFEQNDVILAKITPCFENGKAAFLDLLDTPFGFGSTEFHVLRAGHTLCSKFLYFVTRTHRFMETGEAGMTGAAGQKRVPTSFLEDYWLAIPSREEQDQIVSHIEEQSNRIKMTAGKIEQEIALLQEYRTALINEVVTGKRCVLDETSSKQTTSQAKDIIEEALYI